MFFKANEKVNIEPLKYKPPYPYSYDLEIFSFSDLKERTPEGRMYIPYRYEFYMLIFVTQGECVQWIDFEPVTCNPGTVVVVSPSQVHNFGQDENWEGWIVLFRPEFLIPNTSTHHEQKLAFDIERIPKILTLNDTELSRGVDSIVKMAQDSSIIGPEDDIHMLLRYQLYALMAWLNVLLKSKNTEEKSDLQISQRFTCFQKLVEKHYAECSHVSDYAILLNCTEKTLTRVTMEATGRSAKTFISARIALEAKRLLVHTDHSISEIAEKLNFKETTHFSKFFKRETGCKPSDFRTKFTLR